MTKMTKSCFWITVENTNPEQFRDSLERLYETNENITYICGQLEEGTHKHFQCYLQLKTSKPLSWLKNNVSRTAHFEVQYKKATSDNGRHYASKPHEGCICTECDSERASPTVIPDTFVEYGQMRQKGQDSGKRTDIIALRDSVIRGETQREIIENDELVETYARYLKFHDRVRDLYKPPPREEFRMVLYVGETGKGKTKRAYEEYPDLYEVPIDNGTLWLDGYDDHKQVLFDDFMGKDCMSLKNMLKFFDRYVRKVPVKGTHTWFRPELIVVTSNYHPRHWYNWKDREESWRAICRRIDEIWYYPIDSDEPEEQDVQSYLNDESYWPIIPEIGQNNQYNQ